MEIDVYFYIDDYVYEESCVVDDSKMDYCIFMFVFYRCEYIMIYFIVVGCVVFFMGVVICVGIYICFYNWKSIRSYDL